MLIGTKIGDSISTNGVCLTVTKLHKDAFDADVMPETLQRSNLGGLQMGGRVNLERALQLDTRLGGHIVSGHIDETGVIQRIAHHGRDIGLAVACSDALARLTVLKGSIAIDGVSLTVSALAETSFSVEIIPHTWAQTSLCERRVGDRVNLEADVLGKHVARLLDAYRQGVSPGSATVNEDLLRRAGF